MLYKDTTFMLRRFFSVTLEYCNNIVIGNFQEI